MKTKNKTKQKRKVLKINIRLAASDCLCDVATRVSADSEYFVNWNWNALIYPQMNDFEEGKNDKWICWG